MAGWHTIDASLTDEPILGVVDDYVAAAGAVDGSADSTNLVRAGIGWLGEVTDQGPWHGTAAVALVGRLADGRAATRRAADALAGLTDVLVRHADALDALRRRAAVALHGALADLDHLRAAERRLTEARRLLARAEADGEIGAAAAEQHRQRVSTSELAVAARTGQLSGWVRCFGDLADDERRLTSATAVAVADLGEALGAMPAAAHPLGSDAGPACPAPAGLNLTALAESVLARQFERLASGLVARLTALPVTLGASLMTPWREVFAGRPRAEQLAVIAALVHVHGALGGQHAAHDGDLDGTYEWEPRGTWAGQLGVAERSVAGASVMADALALTRGSEWLAPDEFGLVELVGGRYVVVLPGVTDLSNPDLGYDANHRTVRDVDLHALPSSTSAAVSDNRYASMVAEGLAAAGVLPGSEILIVGHSFGADTALDLAADRRFNGPDGYAVTHVVAAGYHSVPQLGDVPGTTSVLVLQNRNDLVIGFEQLAEHPVAAGGALGDAWDSGTDGDFGGMFGSIADVGRELASMGSPAGAPLAPVPRPPWADGEPRATQVSMRAATQTVAVFDGGRRGMGHHQDNYIGYLGGHADAAVADFATDLVGAGYAAPGAVFAVDVSVPLEGSR